MTRRAATIAAPVTAEARLAEIERTLARLELALRKVLPLAARSLSRRQQAARLGVHPSTVWRRERRAAAALVAAAKP